MPIAFPPGDIGPAYAPDNALQAFTSGVDISNLGTVGADFGPMSLSPGIAQDYNTSLAVNLRNMSYQYEAIDFASRINPVPTPLRNDGAFVLQLDSAASNAQIVGITRDSTGTVLGSCVIDLFVTGSDQVVASTVSGADGSFTFGNPGTGPFYLVAYKVGSPDVAGTTANTIMPSPIGTPVLSPISLRLASALNRRAETSWPSTATQTKLWFRHKVIIGSNNFSSLRLSFPATVFGNDDVPVGNDYTIELCALEKESGGAAYTPVLFGGQASAVVANGVIEFLSDQILPSSFGLANFTRGDIYWVRGLLSVAGNGNFFPCGQFGSIGAGGSALVHDPVTTGISSVYGTGGPSYSAGTGGSGPVDYSFVGGGFHTVVLGTPVDATGKYIVGLGDSIVAGTGETAAPGGGWLSGFFVRGLIDADFVSNPIAGLNFGWPGSVASQWGYPLAASKKLLSYANVTVEEYGTNSGQYANSSSIWALAKGLGHKVVRTKLLTITTSTDTWATKANQTKLAGWTTPGGGQITFNDQIAAQEGVLFDKFVSFDAVALDGTDRDYWRSPGYTIDGTHPTSVAHEAMAAVLRTAIAALP